MIDDLPRSIFTTTCAGRVNRSCSKLEGLSEYDVRRPLTRTGTNLLGLIKHLTLSEARYFGEIFDRPFPESLPLFDDPEYKNRDHMWVTEPESRADVIDGYKRAFAYLTPEAGHEVGSVARILGRATLFQQGHSEGVGWLTSRGSQVRSLLRPPIAV